MQARLLFRIMLASVVLSFAAVAWAESNWFEPPETFNYQQFREMADVVEEVQEQERQGGGGTAVQSGAQKRAAQPKTVPLPPDAKVYTVDEFAESGLAKGETVFVEGIVDGCLALNLAAGKVDRSSAMYGDSCHLYGEKHSIAIMAPGLRPMTGQKMILKGNVTYCVNAEKICGLGNIYFVREK